MGRCCIYRKFTFTLSTLLLGAFLLLPLKAAFAIKHEAPITLKEQQETQLPSGKRLISEIRKIQGGKAFKMPKIPEKVWKPIERFFTWLGHLWVKIFNHPRKAIRLPNFGKIGNVLVYPCIILIILFVAVHFLLRYRKGVQRKENRIKAVKDPWHYHLDQALSLKETDPKSALGELIRAIIRYFVAKGQLGEDPSLTVREIEKTLATLRLTTEELAAFKSLRSFYENAIYGSQTIQPNDWKLVFKYTGLLIGEEVKD